MEHNAAEGKPPVQDPVIRGWFYQTIGAPTEVQRAAWPAIQDGQDVLIAAPTGSGKTLAAMLPCLDRIVQENHAWAARKEEGSGLARRPGVRLLYITPLKALNNDVHHHLFGFIAEMEAYARTNDLPWPGLTVGIRTGDTTQSTRASMIKHPPDVLVTTPESLYLLLGSEKAKAMLATVEQVIVDEIHQLAADKRGLHMSVTLERLSEWCGRDLQRIGVSATIRPLERVAAFLAGYAEDGQPRPAFIVESRMDKKFELSVAMPATMRRRRKGDDESAWAPLLELLLARMEGSRSVLIFVNNRRLCERLTLRLNDHVGYDMARSHHGSVSREKRLDVERALKAGELRCLVATASLELGIDVGHIDLVIQIDSPQSAAAGIQRIGRAGHSVGDVSRGVIVAREPGALAECALLARDIAARAIEDIQIPEGDLDVLSQQLTAMAAAGPMAVARAYALLRRSYGYRALGLPRLTGMLRVLSGYYPFSKPLLDWTQAEDSLQPRSNTKMAALLGAGTIPQSSAFSVYHHETRTQLGELDEEFIHESRVGDVFMLGTSSWMIQSIQNDRVTVREASNAYSEIPFWRGEGAGRSIDVSRRLGALAGELLERMSANGGKEPDQGHELGLGEGEAGAESRDEARNWLMQDYYMDADAAEQLVLLVERQRNACAVPTDKHIVIEQYKDDVEHVHLVIHSLLGKRVNRTWQLVLQRTLEQTLPYRFYTYVKENGIEFIFPQWDSSWAELILSVTSNKVEPLLREAIAGSPLFGAAFRRLAETSLLLARNYGRTPLWVKRLRSEALLRDALPYAEQFPLLQEAMDVCLGDMLDAPSLIQTLDGIASGAIHVSVHRNAAPSPYAFQFLFEFTNQQIYESDALSRDLQLQLLTLNKEAAVRTFGTQALKKLVETLDPEGSGEWGAATKPIDGAAELYKVLKQRGDSTEAELAKLAEGQLALTWMNGLAEDKKIQQIVLAGEQRWIPADEADTYERFPEDPHSITFILGRYVDRQMYVTEEGLAKRFGLSASFTHSLLTQWAEQGIIEPSPFADEGEALWTSSKAAEQMIRLSSRALRRQAEPIEPARLCERITWLHDLQPEDPLIGDEGLRQAIEKLQGIFLPLSHWETFVFPTRLPDYRKEWLDQLCATGEVIWLGRKEEGEKEGRIAFFLAETKSLYKPFMPSSAPERHEEIIELLRSKGASFLTALSRDSAHVPSELLHRLLELAWDGYVSNDQFAPVRLHGLAGAKNAGKSGAGSKGREGRGKFQSGLGRWYLVETLGNAETAEREREAQLGPGSAPEGRSLSQATSDSAFAGWIQHLMNTFGVFTKSMLADRLYVPADRLNEPIRQLETWGLLTRGLWVRGIQELQFSTPPELEKLRQPEARQDRETLPLVINAADPANPYGMLLPWPESDSASFARKSNHYLVLRSGRIWMWIENNGKRFFPLDPEWLTMNPEDRLQALSGIVRVLYRLSGIRKLVVEAWNGIPLAESEGASLFEKLGAERDRQSAVLWYSSLSRSPAAVKKSNTP